MGTANGAIAQGRYTFFDMGGTLETLEQNDDMMLSACGLLLERLSAAGMELGVTPAECLKVVSQGLGVYYRWRQESQRELPPATVWRDFAMRRYVIVHHRLGGILEAVGEELAFVWDTIAYRRDARPGVSETLRELVARGIGVGVISNTFSIRQVRYDLGRFGVEELVQPIVLSATCGLRKPGVSIFHLAARLAGVAPSQCAFVGDSLPLDVAGAREAGFGLTILVDAPFTETFAEPCEARPDAVVRDLREILDLPFLGGA